MGIFCKESVEAAFLHLKRKGIAANKDQFWYALSQRAEETPNIPKKYSSESLRIYLNGKSELNDEQINSIKKIGGTLGVVFELEEEATQPFVLDAALMNLQCNLLPKEKGKNRIEPLIDTVGELHVILRRGFKTINFGAEETAPALYSASLYI